jgi:hypothetical protein
MNESNPGNEFLLTTLCCVIEEAISIMSVIVPRKSFRNEILTATEIPLLQIPLERNPQRDV